MEFWEVSGRKIASVEDSKVETFMARKGFIGDNFGGQEQALLISARVRLGTLIEPSF